MKSLKSHTSTHLVTHTHTQSCLHAQIPNAISKLEEDRGLLRWRMGPWGWQRGHDCLPCQPPLPWNSTETKPHQQTQLTTREKTAREPYFNSLSFGIHHHPLPAICAVKLYFLGETQRPFDHSVWKCSRQNLESHSNSASQIHSKGYN